MLSWQVTTTSLRLMVVGLANQAQLALLSLLFIWPSSRCPDVTCSGPRAIEVIPDSVKESLEFAHESARRCQDGEVKVPVLYSGFWYGFALGVFVSTLILLILYICIRCSIRAFALLQPGRAITSANLEAAKALPRSLPAVLENRPATPSDLRALGLA